MITEKKNMKPHRIAARTAQDFVLEKMLHCNHHPQKKHSNVTVWVQATAYCVIEMVFTLQSTIETVTSFFKNLMVKIAACKTGGLFKISLESNKNSLYNKDN